MNLWLHHKQGPGWRTKIRSQGRRDKNQSVTSSPREFTHSGIDLCCLPFICTYSCMHVHRTTNTHLHRHKRSSSWVSLECLPERLHCELQPPTITSLLQPLTDACAHTHRHVRTHSNTQTNRRPIVNHLEGHTHSWGHLYAGVCGATPSTWACEAAGDAGTSRGFLSVRTRRRSTGGVFSPLTLFVKGVTAVSRLVNAVVRWQIDDVCAHMKETSTISAN